MPHGIESFLAGIEFASHPITLMSDGVSILTATLTKSKSLQLP